MMKSPLAQAFGKAIQKRREKLNMSVQDITTKLSVSSTYYKAVENGTYNLHVNKSYDLCKVLDADTGEFILANVIHLLGFMSILEAAYPNYKKEKLELAHPDYKKNKKKYKDLPFEDNPTKHAEIYYTKFIELTAGNIDIRMKIIKEKFERCGIFEIIQDRDIQSKEFQEAKKPKGIQTSKEIGSLAISDRIEMIILENEIDDDILNFLAQPINLDLNKDSELSEHFSSQFFSDFPTYYLGFLLDVKQSLKKIPHKFNYRHFWQWEKENQSKFVRVICICEEKNLLISSLSRRKYNYSYLNEETFKEAKFIVLNSIDEHGKLTEENPKNLKEEMKFEIKSCLTKQMNLIETTIQEESSNSEKSKHKIKLEEINNQIKNLNKNIQKVAFKVSNTQVINLQNLLTKPIYNKKFNVFWIFELEKNHSCIGFKAIIEKGEYTIQDIDNLSYGEAESLKRKFNTFWANLT